MPDTSPDAPETEEVTSRRIACDGGGALGHPRVWMTIGDAGFVECGYCDKRFVLAGAEIAETGATPGDGNIRDMGGKSSQETAP